jgi:2-polyprenyl-3-methyl-5-hydroxy-6-metoxy-1,4-benzoquinol methylase
METLSKPSEPSSAEQVPEPNDAAQLAGLISEITGESPEVVREKLHVECQHPGKTVADDFQRSGAPRYVFGPGMEAFYNKTQAFLYELAVWNRNELKKTTRRFTARHLGRARRPMDVLCIGDGLGFDCLHFCRKGHRVTYFDLPGPSEQFARRLFAQRTASGVNDLASAARAGADAAEISVLTDPGQIPRSAFDAITCFDVLEHVPDPPAMVRDIASYLRPGGYLYVSAPFYMLFPWYPTHLRTNRQYAGRLDLYTQAGLEIVGGRFTWYPLIVRKSGGEPLPNDFTLLVRASGLVQQLGRWTRWPFLPIHWLRRMFNPKF